MAVSKAEDGAIAHAGVLVAVSTLVITAVLAWRVRDLAGAWLAVAGGLATLTAAAVLTKVPVVGWSAVGTYEGTAYNGAWFMFGLIGLALPRGDRSSRGSAYDEQVAALRADQRRVEAAG